jgi:hypothetical protein
MGDSKKVLGTAILDDARGSGTMVRREGQGRSHLTNERLGGTVVPQFGKKNTVSSSIDAFFRRLGCYFFLGGGRTAATSYYYCGQCFGSFARAPAVRFIADGTGGTGWEGCRLGVAATEMTAKTGGSGWAHVFAPSR